VVDQEPSQANRVEEALRDARDAGRLRLPLFELRAATPSGEIRLTSLDCPHRYADAYVRDSLVGGLRFDTSPAGGGSGLAVAWRRAGPALVTAGRGLRQTFLAASNGGALGIIVN